MIVYLVMGSHSCSVHTEQQIRDNLIFLPMEELDKLKVYQTYILDDTLRVVRLPDNTPTM